jgi:hypothetical protein
LTSEESERDGSALRQEGAEAAEEVADVVELLYRMERRMVRVEVLIGSTLGGVGLVAAGVLATVLKVYLG